MVRLRAGCRCVANLPLVSINRSYDSTALAAAHVNHGACPCASAPQLACCQRARDLFTHLTGWTRWLLQEMESGQAAGRMVYEQLQEGARGPAKLYHVAAL